MNGIVVAVAQQKGGAGKTTLSTHLAAAWTKAGRKVALVDVDPQGSLAAWGALRAAQGGRWPALAVEAASGWRADSIAGRLAAGHEIVLVDTPPHGEIDTKAVVRAAALIVVPVQPSPLDVWATRPTLKLAKAEGRPALVVLNRVPARATLNEAMREMLAAEGARIARATLGSRVAFAAAVAEGATAIETAPTSLAAREATALAEEVLKAARAAARR
ncbi:MAG: ParA family partition ATPase [Alphaproteobacteria bacterium]